MPDDAPTERRRPSDLSDAEWSVLEPLLARRSRLGQFRRCWFSLK